MSSRNLPVRSISGLSGSSCLLRDLLVIFIASLGNKASLQFLGGGFRLPRNSLTGPDPITSQYGSPLLSTRGNTTYNMRISQPVQQTSLYIIGSITSFVYPIFKRPYCCIRGKDPSGLLFVPLPYDLIRYDGSGDSCVQRRYLPQHRNIDYKITALPHQLAHALSFAADDQRDRPC